MRKLGWISLVVLSIVFTSCSKNSFEVLPASTENIINEAIQFDGYNWSKTSDVFAVSSTANESSTSFNSTSNLGTAKIEVTLPKIKPSNNTVKGMHDARIKVNYQGEEWSSSNGHQKGSTFEIIQEKNLEASSGYIKALTIQTNCYLYNDKGQSKAFNCLVTLKY